jgi:hypothetical protein
LSFATVKIPPTIPIPSACMYASLIKIRSKCTSGVSAKRPA